ncbi:JAB domain-containing protein [Macrococcoides canis]|uniref:JAB domain-containing protein n=1 Tax=Macrococcoides canis TaxID=1855823 RepID=UPI0022B85AA9|nr:JAB domain-containing protein [Macrococcus canis]WBF54027.1 JAB domain-containing protein [Macrococcus canis]
MNFDKTNYIYEIKDVKQYYRKTRDERIKVKSPENVADFCKKLIGNSVREKFLLVGLNTKNEVTFVYTVFIGTINMSPIHPREVFQVAILNSCASIILAHCHPSDDPTPSNEDREATKRFEECGELLGIPVLDHIIVTENSYFSFRENNLF